MIDKTKFQEVGGGIDTDRMWYSKDNPLKIGDSIEGKYIDKAENVGPRKNSNIYVLEVGNEKVGVWGSTVIDGRFEKIAKGKMVAIEYLGLQKTKDGKAEYKDFYIGVEISDGGRNDKGFEESQKKTPPDIEYPESEVDKIPF
jgi:hypothetical protein